MATDNDRESVKLAEFARRGMAAQKAVDTILAPVTSIQLRRDGLSVVKSTSRTAPKPERKRAKR